MGGSSRMGRVAWRVDASTITHSTARLRGDNLLLLKAVWVIFFTGGSVSVKRVLHLTCTKIMLVYVSNKN